MIKVDKRHELRVVEYRPWASTVIYEYCWLDCDGQPVAVVKLFRQNADSARVISAIEVHPQQRGRRLSAVLMRAVLDHVGPVWRTGTFSRSGWAAAKHLPDIPYLPDYDRAIDPLTGERPPRKPHVDDIDDFHFVCWERGQFLE